MTKKFRSDSFDPAISAIMQARYKENSEGFTLIASENHPHPEDIAVMRDADDASFAGGYFEGYPPTKKQSQGAGRFYQGVYQADALEAEARSRVVSVIAPGMEDVAEANVQAPSGAIANMVVYGGLMNIGDKMVSPSLARGYGHLSHGADSPNIVKDWFEVHGYGIDEESGYINYDEMERVVEQVRPKLLVSGFSSYPREVDWARIADIANKYGAVSMADISHPGGIIGAGLMNNPFLQGIDVITSTTHKTWGGVKGAVIVYNRESLSKKRPEGVAEKGPNAGRYNKIDFSLFPGMLGGPNMSIIASYTSLFRRAKTESFKEVQKRTQDNAQVLAQELLKRGWPLATDGTDNHIVLVSDVTAIEGIDPDVVTDGWEAAKILEDCVGIVTNKNAVPGVPGTAIRPRGVRLGTPALATRGLGTDETRLVAQVIDSALRYAKDTDKLNDLRNQIRDLAHAFPVPYWE
ncbi:MAG: serine hydroxymethyltransferase [Alphaproteobacteria bacterium]